MQKRFLLLAAFLLLFKFSSAPAFAQVKQWSYAVPIPAGKTLNSGQNIASDAAGNSVWSFRFSGGGPSVVRVVWLDGAGREILAKEFVAQSTGHSVSVAPLRFSRNELIVEKVDSLGTIDGDLPVTRTIVRFKRFPTRVTEEAVPFLVSDVPVHPDFVVKSSTGFLTFATGVAPEIKRFKF